MKPNAVGKLMKSNTVGKLIELLSMYPKDMEISNQNNENFIHIVNTESDNVILSTEKPIAFCNRTGSYVYPTQSEGYFGYVPELDEDVYKFETTPLKKKKKK
jgi:hypothetical protein